jgi:hypothetical protein
MCTINYDPANIIPLLPQQSPVAENIQNRKIQAIADEAVSSKMCYNNDKLFFSCFHVGQ